ncbi:hypothetical protein ACIODT_13175 [Streptomyces sp. NPDC088251]|uniref:hypothetical protein n=1 Tax=unclassified Streptomyces TaxID=2593676 RepID=UPI0033FE9CFA
MTTQAAAPQLTQEEFDTLLDQINAHHKATLAAITAGRPKPAPFQLPEGITENDDYRDLPQSAIDAFGVSRDNNSNQATNNQSHVSDIADKRNSGSISEDDFDSQLDQQKEDNKDKFGKDQDDLTNELKKAGHAHPEKQNEILAAFKSAGDWIIDNVWNKVKEFFQQLVDKLKELWNKVVDWFEDKVQGLVNWWHGIFG